MERSEMEEIVRTKMDDRIRAAYESMRAQDHGIISQILESNLAELGKPENIHNPGKYISHICLVAGAVRVMGEQVAIHYLYNGTLTEDAI